MPTDNAGSVSGINVMGAEWGFTLYDDQERKIVSFSFRLRDDAVKARRAMSDMVAKAMAILPAEGIGGHAAVPIVKA
jgi:hypothetical protein